jgi:hypothetical protein
VAVDAASRRCPRSRRCVHANASPRALKGRGGPASALGARAQEIAAAPLARPRPLARIASPSRPAAGGGGDGDDKERTNSGDLLAPSPPSLVLHCQHEPQVIPSWSRQILTTLPFFFPCSHARRPALALAQTLPRMDPCFAWRLSTMPTIPATTAALAAGIPFLLRSLFPSLRSLHHSREAVRRGPFGFGDGSDSTTMGNLHNLSIWGSFSPLSSPAFLASLSSCSFCPPPHLGFSNPSILPRSPPFQTPAAPVDHRTKGAILACTRSLLNKIGGRGFSGAPLLSFLPSVHHESRRAPSPHIFRCSTDPNMCVWYVHSSTTGVIFLVKMASRPSPPFPSVPRRKEARPPIGLFLRGAQTRPCACMLLPFVHARGRRTCTCRTSLMTVCAR